MEVLYFIANGRQYYSDEKNDWYEQNKGYRIPLNTKFIGSFYVDDTTNLGEVLQRLIHEGHAGGFETDFVEGNYALGVEGLGYVIERKDGKLKLKQEDFEIKVTGPIETVFRSLE